MTDIVDMDTAPCGMLRQDRGSMTIFKGAVGYFSRFCCILSPDNITILWSAQLMMGA
jgi:hypothetical protein